jgi:2-isopropylmalate synthase
VNLALNFYTQGIHPGLDLSDLQSIIDTVTQCNDIAVHPRHPYAGELVYTAFSGSHQDAIKKGFEAQQVRHKLAAAEGKPQYWDIPYLPIDPADIGQTYEAIIRVNSQSGKGGIAYLVKQHLGLDLPRKLQIAFYRIVQAISDREAREVTIDDITTAFRTTYYLGGTKYRGRLSLRNFKISSEKEEDLVDDCDETKDERRHFDGTLSMDGMYRVIRGDGNGPLSALLDALRSHLLIDLTIRDYTEHSIGEGKEAKAASFVELVPAGDRKSNQSWWGVGVDCEIVGSGLHAVLSAVNSAIGDLTLPEMRRTMALNSHSCPSDIASLIVNAFGLELPRRLQSSFFEVIQRTSNDSNGKISHEGVIKLFQSTYGYYPTEGPVPMLSLGDFKLEKAENRNRRFVGDIVIEGQKQMSVNGVGNGPLSATLAALRDIIDGVLMIREYAEHSVGEGTEVLAASYVELVYEVSGAKRAHSWGVSTDTDITGSGIKAVLTAASNIGVVVKI